MGNYKGVYLKGPLEEVAFPSQDYAQPVHYIKDQALLEKEMETHSSALVWRIPGMREPGGLLSMGSMGISWSPLCALKGVKPPVVFG